MALNWGPLLEILQDLGKLGIQPDIFSAAVFLLGGSAFGFIIHQFWWMFYLWKGAEYWSDRRSINSLINRFGLSRPKCKQNGKKIIVALDYVLHHGVNKERSRIFSYIVRRWDMYHLLSSEIFALLMGFVLGMLLRVYFYLDMRSWEPREVFNLSVIYIVVVFLMCLLYKGRQWVQFQRDVLSAGIVNDSEITRSELGTTFPPYIFDFTIGEKQSAKLEEAGISSVCDLAEEDPGGLFKKIQGLSEESGISKEDLSGWIKKAKKFMNSCIVVRTKHKKEGV